MKLIYCIIITYNGIRWVDKCFTSLRCTDYPIKIIVVDNGSIDGTQKAILEGFPEVELVQSNINLGFGKANNLGIQIALERGADYIFLLNQDAYLLDCSLANLIDKFENEPLAGIISPIHLAGDERNIDRGFLNYIQPKNTPKLIGDLATGKLDKLYETEFVNAAAWVMPSKVVERIGMFHPIFDHYGEDNEYVNRLRANDYKIFICPNAIIVHDRPQDNDVKEKGERYSKKYKQRILVKYCIGKYNERQVDLNYFKVLLYNIVRFNIKYSIESVKNWIDIKKKIKSFRSYSFNLYNR